MRTECRGLLGAVAILLGSGCGWAAPAVKDDATARGGAVVQAGSPLAPRSANTKIFSALSPKPFPQVPPDVSNRWADDPDAALLGQRLFFDTRFSGPLLASEHDGSIFGSGLGTRERRARWPVPAATCRPPYSPTHAAPNNRSRSAQRGLIAGHPRSSTSVTRRCSCGMGVAMPASIRFSAPSKLRLK